VSADAPKSLLANENWFALVVLRPLLATFTSPEVMPKPTPVILPVLVSTAPAGPVTDTVPVMLPELVTLPNPSLTTKLETELRVSTLEELEELAELKDGVYGAKAVIRTLPDTIFPPDAVCVKVPEALEKTSTEVELPIELLRNPKALTFRSPLMTPELTADAVTPSACTVTFTVPFAIPMVPLFTSVALAGSEDATCWNDSVEEEVVLRVEADEVA
jgi:hypothetical protein